MQLPRSDAADPQERQFGTARDHRLRLKRKHQEGAGEERHQGQYIEIHPVGARHVRHALGGLVRRAHRHASGQQRRDPFARNGRRHAGSDFDVDAVQPAD